MLILSRRAAERIYLGDDIVLTIVAVGADKVRIGVKAPAGVRILRNELEQSSAPILSGEIRLLAAGTADVEDDSSVAPDNAPAEFPRLADNLASDEAVPNAAGLKTFMRSRRAA